MPGRSLAAKELATLLNALAHPVRVRIVEELHGRPMDVNTLQSITAVSSSNVSQHLAILRTHRIVQERREGRRVIYSLPQPAIAAWLIQGLDFIERELANSAEMRDAVASARQSWTR